MTKTAFVIAADERRKALNVLGTSVTVLVSGEDAHDQRITIQSGEAGMGPPPHSHDWTESFFVSRGQIEFTCDGNTRLCDPGTLVHVPAGVVHMFAYGPDGGEMIEITGQGSKAIDVFSALSNEMPAGAPDVAKAVRLLGDHGVTVHV